MRVDRLGLEAGGRGAALDLHPRLTVVAGLAPAERAALAAELVAALGPGRPGLHLELSDDHGRRLAVYRPGRGPAHVVDIDTAADLTDRFRGDDGAVDVWAAHGIDPPLARALLRMGAADLTNASRGDELVRRLAELDEAELWSTAAEVRLTDEELQTEADAMASSTGAAHLVDVVEQRHQRLAALLGRYRRLLLVARVVGALCCLAACAAIVWAPVLAPLALVVAALMTTFAFVERHRLQRAGDAERAALDEVGASSYLGFHLHRVSGMLHHDQSRRHLQRVAGDARTAAARWAALVGDVSVDWAFDHEEQITAAAGLRRDLQRLEAIALNAPTVPGSRVSDHANDLAQALVVRLARLRHLAPDGESFPLILDEPFAGVDAATKPALLELLLHTAGSPQLVLLTDDEEIASWARLEVLTGELSVVEMGPDRLGDPAAPHSPGVGRSLSSTTAEPDDR